MMSDMSDEIPESEFEPLLTEVGRALHNFTQIELAVARLYGALSRDNGVQTEVVMASIVSFRTRLQVCQSVLLLYPLSPELRAIWGKLSKRLAEELSKRNELAHFSLSTIKVGEAPPYPAVVPYFSHGTFLLTGMREKKHFNLKLEQIKERGETFKQVAEAVWWFQGQIEPKDGLLRQFQPPMNDLIRELQSRAALAPQVKKTRPKS